MKITLTRNDFIDYFKKSYRADQFTDEALSELFDYYDDVYGDDCEFDIIGICSDWTEFRSLKEACEYVGVIYSPSNPQEAEEKLNSLVGHIIRLDNGNYLILE